MPVPIEMFVTSPIDSSPMLVHMSGPEALERGRVAVARRDWAEAFRALSEAEASVSLSAADLDRLAVAAYLTGHDQASADAWTRAHRAHLDDGRPAEAVRSAFWMALNMLLRGDAAPAGGWFGRAGSIAAALPAGSPEQGLMMIPGAMQRLYSGDPEGAAATFVEALAVGRAAGDPDVIVMATHGLGHATIERGSIGEGMSLLDEAMASVLSGETSHILAGIIYCAVIDACRTAFDVRRASQWTEELTRWCDAQPGLVPYRGQCLIHRAELMQMHGSWSDALREADEAKRRLTEPPGHAAAGEAFYQLGEIHRLRGETADAEDAYRSATEFGRVPQPGLALLRLAHGKHDAAAASLRTALDGSRPGLHRARLLPAQVEILLAGGDLAGARASADELAQIAAATGLPMLHAMTAHADGCVRLAEGDPAASVARLREALDEWLRLDAPYQAACTRVAIASACASAGDDDSARMELDAARAAFERLGAKPDLERLDGGRRTAPAGLTPRELEVLGLIATGTTNRGIAEKLVISEKTVARHVSNIFIKTGVSSRAGATTYAHRNGLV